LWPALHAKETAAVTNWTAADLLVTLAEPTRLRILNCVAAAPLFISDLAAILHLPAGTVSAHMLVLQEREVVREFPLEPHVLYTLAPLPGARERVLRAVLDVVHGDATAQADRAEALRRSRTGLPLRVGGAAVHAT
jgi:DNA-binding transcriptional ArsR family regulator